MTDKTDAIWMPLYIDKYLGDTTHLTTEQHGAYLLLLMTAWKRDGLLPKQEQQLQQIARLTPAAWRKHRDVVMAFFMEVEGGYTQKRLAEEFDKASRIIATKRENGKKGGRPRKENLDETGRLTETKPTGLATDNRQGNRGETQSQLQIQKQDQNPVAAVIAQAWWPSPETLTDLRMVHGYDPDWIDQQVPSFVAYWLASGEARTSWESRFIQHCEHRATRRSA